MRRKRKQLPDDAGYRDLQRKILLKTGLLFTGSAVLIVLLYWLFLYQRFADAVVWLLQTLVFRDYDRALQFYWVVFRNNFDLLFLLAIVAVFLVSLRFYLRSFTRYFNEINRAVNALVDRESPIGLSPELAATEAKLRLIRQELVQKEQTTREAEQRKNDLVMYLAHDIRTPLTSVIGYLSLLQQAPDMDAAQRARCTGIALDKAYRLEKMVDEFFEITRFNLQELPLRLQTIDLSFMLVQLADELAPALAENGCTVRLSTQDALSVRADPDRLARVFGNLLKNAAAYSDPGTEVAVCAQREDASVAVRVRNHGPTIPPDRLEAMFERFIRLDEARTSGTGGAGLGLAIAKQIVLQHGGTICAESADGTVTFTVTLPAADSQNIHTDARKS